MIETAATPCNHCGGSEARPLFTRGGYRLVECAGCKLAYIDNPATEDQLAAIYSGEAGYHDHLKDLTSPLHRRLSGVADRHMQTLRRSGAKGRLLDVGCSVGLFLAKARDAGFDAEGVEFSAASAAFARQQFGLTVHTAELADAPLAPASFDVITLFDVIEHLPDPAGELAHIYCLLKPGGTLILSTPNIDGLFPRATYKMASRLDYWPHPEPPHHLFQFSVATLGAMVAKAGFVPGAVEHLAIPISYSFGSLSSLMKRSPKMMVYAAAFAPLAIIGPWIGMGDWIYLTARKA